MSAVRTLTAVALLLCACLPMFLMMTGWRNRQKRFKDIEALGFNTWVPSGEETRKYVGEYVVTTNAGDWLDRINVHALGSKASSRLLLYNDRLCIERARAMPLIIPYDKITGVETVSGAAGKFLGRRGMLLVRHRLGERIVDSYWKPRDDRVEPIHTAILHRRQDFDGDIKNREKDEIVAKK